jgi:hypothetical protein
MKVMISKYQLSVLVENIEDESYMAIGINKNDNNEFVWLKQGEGLMMPRVNFTYFRRHYNDFTDAGIFHKSKNSAKTQLILFLKNPTEGYGPEYYDWSVVKLS